MFLKPKYVKDGELLLKGVRRFINYRSDLLDEEKVAEIEEKAARYKVALQGRRKSEMDKIGKDLTKTCEGVGRDYRQSAFAENVEVIFVAIAIALGVRAYVAQPFKIPTGSMQPTLNGIIAQPSPTPMKNPVVQLFDLARLGRVYVNVVAKEEEVIRSFAERTRLKFFTATFVLCESGNVYKIPAPKAEVERVRGGPFGLRVGQRFGKGDVIARGWVDTGDQVIVDKFSYHFFPPRRGEVFVFTTANIRGIGLQDPNMGSIHYIKRLAGVPKDKLEVRQPDLYVDGSPGTEFGFRRVMSQENGYRGYQGGVDFGVIPEDSYVALGDNSYNSLDSRSWGFVPENNLVGRALLVYWPFNRHFGVIR